MEQNGICLAESCLGLNLDISDSRSKCSFPALKVCEGNLSLHYLVISHNLSLSLEFSSFLFKSILVGHTLS